MDSEYVLATGLRVCIVEFALDDLAFAWSRDRELIRKALEDA